MIYNFVLQVAFCRFASQGVIKGGSVQASLHKIRMADFLVRVQFQVTDNIKLCLTSCILWVMAFMASSGGAV